MSVVIIRDTPHHRSVYQADNFEFFQVLISWTSGGTIRPGWEISMADDYNDDGHRSRFTQR